MKYTVLSNHKMPLSPECLPAEVWLMVFSFIEGNDLRRAFSCLNSFFTALLYSPHLRVHLNVTTGGYRELSPSHISFCHEAYESLHANIHGISDLLLFLDRAHTLPNLRSLSLHIRRQTNYSLLISILPRLTSLQHLTISYAILSADSMMASLHTEILKLPQLRTCRLRLSRITSNTPIFSPNLLISTSLRHFYVNAWIRPVDLCHLVMCMPSLRFLNVYLYHHSVNIWDDLLFPQFTKRACVSLVNQHVDLKRLTKAAPNLMHFNIHIEPYVGQSPRYSFRGNCSINSEIDHIHVKMTWKKDINSGMLKLIPPVTIQGQKLVKEECNVDWSFQEYEIIQKYSNFV